MNLTPVAKVILDVLCASCVGVQPEELKSRVEIRGGNPAEIEPELDKLIKAGLVRKDPACKKHPLKFNPTPSAWAHL